MTALIRSSRDHGTRPVFMEKAAASQYSQNAAQPTAKTSSTALIVSPYFQQARSSGPARASLAWAAPRLDKVSDTTGVRHHCARVSPP